MMRNIQFSVYIFILTIIAGCNKQDNVSQYEVDYFDNTNWAYYPAVGKYDTDVFFVAPTVFMGDDSTYNMNLNDSHTIENFIGAINMQKGIYDGNSDFYAPLYRQVSLNCFQKRGYDYSIDDSMINYAFKTAYKDVENAFMHYISISDNPFILAGFSQGSEMLVTLLKNHFNKKEFRDRLIAAYTIGWRIRTEEIAEYPHLKTAESYNDNGVIICYSTEAEFIQSSLIVPEATLSINPLNWRTDSAFGKKDLNEGACFTDYSGNITLEIPQLTGAYICPVRGTLKATDVTPEDYPPILDIFKEGEYHIYDYMFFYRNLQANVKHRIESYFN